MCKVFSEMKLRRSEHDTFGVRRMLGRLKIGDRIEEAGRNGRRDPGKKCADSGTSRQVAYDGSTEDRAMINLAMFISIETTI
jgi:hypothetical protein